MALKFTKFPIVKSMEIKSGPSMVYDDHYWVIEDECLLFFRGYSPQCNKIKGVAEQLSFGKEVRLLPRVFIPQRWSNDEMVPDLE